MQGFQTEKKNPVFQSGDIVCLINKLNVEQCVLPKQCTEMKSSYKEREEEAGHSQGEKEDGKLLRTGRPSSSLLAL